MNVSQDQSVVSIAPVPRIENGVYDPDEILFPDSDGKPMADNTIQYRWIVTIKGNLDRLYAGNADVFVAGDLLWYAEQDAKTPRQAPDVMVVWGRPKGDRGSWQPWKEGGTAPQVVFEVMSPGNRAGEMTRKFEFYDRYGVAEYYIYDPKDGDLSVWIRGTGETGDGTNRLRAVNYEDLFVSPLMGTKFAPRMNREMEIFYPNGRRFLTMDEMDAERERAEAERDSAVIERDSAVIERDSAVALAEGLAARTEQLAAKLREMGIDPDGV